MQKLTVHDIVDLRAYERERDAFRRHVIELKKRRRIHLGTIVTLTFENADTVRFQIQEMARAERMLRDEQIAHEVEVYNELIPDPGELSATLFLELTSDDQLREWLPKLVGVQRHVRFRFGSGDGAENGVDNSVDSIPEDEERLTREDETTPAVHYVKFRFTPTQAAALREGPAFLEITHAEYRESVELSPAQRSELAADLAL
ncbi:MAG: DUF3501 family protein [Acidimicrobiia bacterium]|nr:DUF3501 family protein [Acidimicrobiia bacterium]